MKLSRLILIIFLLCLIITGCSPENGSQLSFDLTENEIKPDLLILVNKDNKISEDYNIDLIDIGNFKAAVILASDLEEMITAAKKENIEMYISSAYRTIEEQRQIFDNTVAGFINNGNSPEVAEERARNIAALPGHSEHHTGLAVDFTNGGDYDENKGAVAATLRGWFRLRRR